MQVVLLTGEVQGVFEFAMGDAGGEKRGKTKRRAAAEPGEERKTKKTRRGGQSRTRIKNGDKPSSKTKKGRAEGEDGDEDGDGNGNGAPPPLNTAQDITELFVGGGDIKKLGRAVTGPFTAQVLAARYKEEGATVRVDPTFQFKDLVLDTQGATWSLGLGGGGGDGGDGDGDGNRNAIVGGGDAEEGNGGTAGDDWDGGVGAAGDDGDGAVDGKEGGAGEEPYGRGGGGVTPSPAAAAAAAAAACLRMRARAVAAASRASSVTPALVMGLTAQVLNP